MKLLWIKRGIVVSGDDSKNLTDGVTVKLIANRIRVWKVASRSSFYKDNLHSRCQPLLRPTMQKVRAFLTLVHAILKCAVISTLVFQQLVSIQHSHYPILQIQPPPQVH